MLHPPWPGTATQQLSKPVRQARAGGSVLGISPERVYAAGSSRLLRNVTRNACDLVSYRKVVTEALLSGKTHPAAELTLFCAGGECVEKVRHITRCEEEACSAILDRLEETIQHRRYYRFRAGHAFDDDQRCGFAR